MFSYVRITGFGELPDLSKANPFASIVVIEESVLPERQREVSKWLVRSGCLYMMAWGQNCSSWDDSVDIANLEEHGFGEIPVGNRIITTWHDNSALEDVMTFAKSFTRHPDVTIRNLVILHLSQTDKSEKFERMYAEAEVVKFE